MVHKYLEIGCDTYVVCSMILIGPAVYIICIYVFTLKFNSQQILLLFYCIFISSYFCTAFVTSLHQFIMYVAVVVPIIIFYPNSCRICKIRTKSLSYQFHSPRKKSVFPKSNCTRYSTRCL